MNLLKTKLAASAHKNTLYKPLFFRLNNAADRSVFNEIISREDVMVYDEILSQAKELVKSRNPRRKLNADDYKAEIELLFEGQPVDEYGVWVYYEWSGRMIHMLDETEFIELRTSANRQKITVAERELLATKKVGVIGLSVGQSVSVTLAMERGCGELRLADFDTLELNNLNRIRTGLHNLGLLKAYSVAREIAEIDPFFKVVCYTEGITQGNIDHFFLEGGKLDAVIDECDGVNIKILCRLKAKELHVPVLMEASDRGTLDVERFDLEPGRAIMHGWLKHLPLDLDTMSKLNTPDEKLAYILPISGLDTLSARMRASMIEIQNTITTWPQLATAVTLGGAVTADTCRRIFLNQFSDSGRYFIDLENLVREAKPRKGFVPDEGDILMDDQDLRDIAQVAMERLSATGYEPAVDEVMSLVNAAVKAPSFGNIQPWRWYYQKGYLLLFSESEAAYPFEDVYGSASYMANGAALENLELEANKRKLTLKVSLMPLPRIKKLVAVIQFRDEQPDVNESAVPEDLVKYLDYRMTARSLQPDVTIGREKFTLLKKVVGSVPGVSLITRANKDDIEQLAQIAGVAERIRLLHAPSHHEFFQQLRWSNDECNRTGDGIHIDGLGLSEMELIMLKMIRKPEVAKLLSDWNMGQALEFSMKKNILASSAIGLLTIPDYSPINYILAGRALQRMWLTATKYDVSLQPVQALVTQIAHYNNNSLVDFPAPYRDELMIQFRNFNKIFKEAGEKRAVFLFRMGYSEQPAIKTFRKQIEKVLFLPNNKL